MIFLVILRAQVQLIYFDAWMSGFHFLSIWHSQQAVALHSTITPLGTVYVASSFRALADVGLYVG